MLAHQPPRRARSSYDAYPAPSQSIIASEPRTRRSGASRDPRRTWTTSPRQENEEQQRPHAPDESRRRKWPHEHDGGVSGEEEKRHRRAPPQRNRASDETQCERDERDAVRDGAREPARKVR